MNEEDLLNEQIPAGELEMTPAQLKKMSEVLLGIQATIVSREAAKDAIDTAISRLTRRAARIKERMEKHSHDQATRINP